MHHTVERQLTVALENQPGRLAAIGRSLAARGVNIRDLCVIDNVEQGVVRFVPSDPLGAREVLEQEGLHVIEAEVLVVDLKDMPGALANFGQALADAGVNIDYAYGTEGPAERMARFVVKVSNLPRAVAAVAGLR